MSRFKKIKNLNQSENPLQSLSATNCTSDVQECTRVHYFVRIRTLFKKRIYGKYNEKSKEIWIYRHFSLDINNLIRYN